MAKMRIVIDDLLRICCGVFAGGQVASKRSGHLG